MTKGRTKSPEGRWSQEPSRYTDTGNRLKISGSCFILGALSHSCMLGCERKTVCPFSYRSSNWEEGNSGRCTQGNIQEASLPWQDPRLWANAIIEDDWEEGDAISVFCTREGFKMLWPKGWLQLTVRPSTTDVLAMWPGELTPPTQGVHVPSSLNVGKSRIMEEVIQSQSTGYTRGNCFHLGPLGHSLLESVITSGGRGKLMGQNTENGSTLQQESNNNTNTRRQTWSSQ